DRIGGGFGSFERVGNGKSDVLAPVTDRVIFERRSPLKADAIKNTSGGGAEKFADVPPMEHRTHARHLFSRSSIQRKQFAIRDARFHGNGVKHAGELKIRRELRQSGDFARTVYTEGIASDGRGTWWRLLRGRHCSSLTQLAAAIRSACV